MDFTVIADSATLAAAQTLAFAVRHDLSSYVSDQSSSPSSYAKALQISSLIFPIDAVAPPPVRPNSIRTAPRTMLRRKRRTRRRSSIGDSEDAENGGFFGNGGDGDGTFGGSGGGGGWNYGGYGGSSWDESSCNSFGSDFIREVICWIALSNCVHFAFKKVLRILTDGVSDSREKVSMRLTSIC